MKAINTTVLIATLTLVASTGFAAAHSTKQIDRNQALQFERIEDARLRGDLTKREYRQLLEEQNRIADLERAAKADGRVTSREVRELKSAQSEARENISNEEQDGQKAWLRRFLYKTR